MIEKSIQISVIIPVYNVEKYLHDCLDSIVNQTFHNIEILAVNDGSLDKSLEILEEYANRDSRIIIINQTNQGLSAARNNALEAVKGKYCLFLDSDDTLEREALFELLEYAENENLDIVIFGYTKLFRDGRIIAKPDFGSKILFQDTARRESISLRLSPMACNKLYKTKLFTGAQIKYPLGFIHEDIGTTYKLFWNVSRVGTISKSYYNWFVTGSSSITGNFTKKSIDDVLYLLADKKKFLVDKGQFTEYEEEYVRALFQMVTLFLERAMEKASVDNDTLNYMIYSIEEHSINSEKNKEILKWYDRALYIKFNYTFYQSIKKDIELLKLDTQKNSNRISSLNKKLYLNKINKMFFIKGKITEYSYLFLPIGSNRRELIKKLKNVILKGVAVQKEKNLEVVFDLQKESLYYNLEGEYLGMFVFHKGELSDFRAIIRKNRLQVDSNNIYEVLRTGLFELLNHYLSERLYFSDEEVQKKKSNIVDNADEVLKKIVQEIIGKNVLEFDK